MAGFTMNWGIMATGGISAKFAKDIQVDPKTRKVTDVLHKIVAVGSQTSADRAQSFIKEQCNGDKDIKAYGNYAEFLKDPNVKAVYIGTPHSEHWVNARDCILAGKHVLCEKPVTVNAKQAQGLVDLAKKHSVFFMEAVWTRFFPITYEIQELIESGAIGRVTHTTAQLAIDMGIENMDSSHRLIKYDLSGGSLLDLGPYPWVWTAMTVLHPYIKSDPTLSQDKNAKIPLPPISSMFEMSGKALTDRVGGAIDLSATAIIKFPMPQLSAWKDEPNNAENIISTIQTSMVARTTNDRAICVQGTKGYIIIPFPPFRPQGYVLNAWDSAQAMKDANADNPTVHKKGTQDFPGGISGFAWEADATARCVRDGQIECDRMPWRESVFQMELFDKIREQGNFKYPDSIEGTPSA